MKRLIVLFLIIAAACGSAFAFDLQLGVAQNLLNTSLLVDSEFKHFGIEASAGVPVASLIVSGIAAGINEAADNVSSSMAARGESEESGSGSSGGFSLPAGVMANVYVKLFTAGVFSMRLGLQVDVLGIYGSDYTWIQGYSGLSLGLNFKFSERFGMNLTGAIPLAALLSPFGEEVIDKTLFFYTSDNEKVAENVFFAIFGSLGAVGNHIARLSFKWSL